MKVVIRILWVLEAILFIIVTSPFIILMAINWLFTSKWEMPITINQRNKIDDWSSSIERRRRKL